MITLEKYKSHIRVDGDDENIVHQMHLDAATAYVASETGIDADDVDDPRYDMAILLLAAHFYLNREAVSTNKMNRIPYGISALILSIKYGVTS